MTAPTEEGTPADATDATAPTSEAIPTDLEGGIEGGVEAEVDESVKASGAVAILRRGLQTSPELVAGLRATVAMGLCVAIGRLAVPVLLQRAIDQGILAEDGVDTGSVVRSSIIIGAIVIVTSVLAYITNWRLIQASESTLTGLRSRAFRKVHQLSIADHNETRRGILLARVTSDVEGLARFTQWGLYAWSINPVLLLGTFLLMTRYSWQLTIVALVCCAPAVPLLQVMQRYQLAAYDKLRTAVGDMVASFSEAINGLPVLRAYGAIELGKARVGDAVDHRYRRAIIANRFMSSVFSVGDLFGSIALAAVVFVGVANASSFGLEAGELVALMFLVTFLLQPAGELAEVMDRTQTAVASWRKILDLLDRPIDVVEPVAGLTVPSGPVAIEVDDITFSYRDAEPVLRSVDLSIPAGTNVAVVGHTGSGKSTIAKLLCRLADPQQGEIRLNGLALPLVDPASRLATVRMVPQDGFLFDTTVRENIRFGRDGASDADIARVLDTLSLTGWVGRLPQGLNTPVGERGGNLSVGERQLVALARAALADPGLLILDEATSAVDPETDQVLTTAIRRLSEGRTLVSIAHRLATAEAADLVVVFDGGEIVELGTHTELVNTGGVYTALHEAWIGSTE